jgi:hypothetical protein
MQNAEYPGTATQVTKTATAQENRTENENATSRTNGNNATLGKQLNAQQQRNVTAATKRATGQLVAETNVHFPAAEGSNGNSKNATANK